MKEFRLKQKRLKKAMTFMLVFAAVFIFIYIGIEPFVVELAGKTVNSVLYFLSNAVVIVAMVLLFLYYSKYSKSDFYLQSIEDEISDVSYYFTSREENESDLYKKAVAADLIDNNFSVQNNIKADGFDFSFKANKGKDYIYCTEISNLDRNDVIAYSDCVLNDLTTMNLKRKGNIVVFFITDKADEGAIALSKMTTAYGRKQQIKINNAIIELSTKRCYFLGNRETKNQANIANYIMNCDLPIKDKFKAKERLAFQDELAEKMKGFDLKKYLDGQFIVH